ncbi:MAG: hypothetical protein ACYTEZ_20375 [Planctomycetota bacterium]
MSLRYASPNDWPALLTAGEIGEIFGCSRRSAQRKIAAGKCGAFIELDGTRYIRREVFLAALKQRERSLTPPPRARRVRARRRRRTT